MSALTDELRGWKEHDGMSDDAIRKVWLMHRAADRLDRQRRVLGWFLADERFQVAVGGNPNVVEKMLADARVIYNEGES